MPDLSPSETLRAAAARLRELAEKAPRGPWLVDMWGDVASADSYAPGAREHHKAIWSEFGDVEIQYAPGVKDWLTAMSPAVAEPLARELELAATWIGPPEQQNCMGYAWAVKRSEHMLAFARTILGGTDA